MWPSEPPVMLSSALDPAPGPLMVGYARKVPSVTSSKPSRRVPFSKTPRLVPFSKRNSPGFQPSPSVSTPTQPASACQTDSSMKP